TEVAFSTVVAGADSDDRRHASDRNSSPASIRNPDRSLQVGPGYMACQWQPTGMHSLSEKAVEVVEISPSSPGTSTGRSHTGVYEQRDETQRVDLLLANGQQLVEHLKISVGYFCGFSLVFPFALLLCLSSVCLSFHFLSFYLSTNTHPSMELDR